ncbi:hypothetical protein ACLI07_23310 (plasmid) [Providencia huaxiensis]|uniref:Uncharacterized protein n=7 Tax=Enterobacterales TaxID=91347 RepID=A0A7L8KC65_ECOLX|nr:MULTISPECIES: hypothetical protein [Enterobacterales]ELB1214834.1 hypothetical protein [Proteus mirabilis]ELY4881476.1 hypothetical protein [Morganella morganii]SPY66617.1 Uncharacterised protein [Providencia stuartii]ELR5094275.1 hypothetical protein [Providencia rettgeri]ELR5243123.1 hypothetical protein [Providencia rettgeri]
MKTLIKFIKSIFCNTPTSTSPDDNPYCNDPIVIADLGRRIEHKEAFFNLYVRCSSDSGSHFPVYLAQMIRSCRLHMFSLPVNERQSFFDFCLVHKVDISIQSLEVANEQEKACLAKNNNQVSFKEA